MKIIKFIWQVPKDLSYPQDNEDAYSENDSVIVLCDGASISFDSKTWATLLSDKFLTEQVIDPAWVDDAISSYRAKFDYQEMSWSRQAAFELGSFSTFLGVTYSASDNRVEIIGIGDTIALLLNNNEIIDSFPYTSAEEFAQCPQLLSTKSEHNTFLFSSNVMTSCRKSWSIESEKNSCLLLMTDALAEWVLRGGQIENSSLKKLLQIDKLLDFEEFVLSERSEKNMRTDDTTLIKVMFEDE